MFDIEEYKKACAKWCRDIRIDKGVPQHKIADELNISTSAVSQFETGKVWSFPLFAYYFNRWGGEKLSWQMSKH